MSLRNKDVLVFHVKISKSTELFASDFNVFSIMFFSNCILYKSINVFQWEHTLGASYRAEWVNHATLNHSDAACT